LLVLDSLHIKVKLKVLLNTIFVGGIISLMETEKVKTKTISPPCSLLLLLSFGKKKLQKKARSVQQILLIDSYFFYI
jgi:hypothetical protein